MATVQGQASAAATSVAIPAHQAGDLIIVAARGTAAAPSVPAPAGTVPAWATLQTGLANAIGLTVVAFVATAATTTTGVFTNATHICVLVLRPGAGKTLRAAAVDSSVGNGNNTQTIVYPALVLNSLGGASQGVRVGTRTVADSEVGTNIPAGWTNQSIQPAGASALMAVHTRLALTANPTADSVSTAGTNAAYRAVTVEVEDVPPPILLDIVITTNQPYAGEHNAGEFLAGQEPILAADLTVIRLATLAATVTGQAQVGASLSVLRSTGVTIVGQAAVTVAANPILPVAASVAGVSAVTGQQTAQRSFAAPIAGAGAVVPLITVSNPSFVTFDATIARQAAVSAQAVSSLSLAASLNRSATVTGQLTPSTPLAASVGGQGTLNASLTISSASFVPLQIAISPQALVTVGGGGLRGLNASIVGQATVGADARKIIEFAVEIGGPPAPLCGQHLCGQFVVDNAGVGATIIADLYQRPPETQYLGVQIGGQAQVSATLGLLYLWPIECVDLDAPAASCDDLDLEELLASSGNSLCGEHLCGTFLCGELAIASIDCTTVVLEPPASSIWPERVYDGDFAYDTGAYG